VIRVLAGVGLIAVLLAIPWVTSRWLMVRTRSQLAYQRLEIEVVQGQWFLAQEAYDEIMGDIRFVVDLDSSGTPVLDKTTRETAERLLADYDKRQGE
jgi:hypothetical protein